MANSHALPMRRKYVNELAESVDLPMKFSNRVLSQFDCAGTNPYCISFARIASVHYRPSTLGERLYNTCLNNLQVYFTQDDRLQFGWNEKFIYRNAGVNDFEYEHLILMGALSECLPASYAAAVLRLLAERYEDEDRINPSLASWRRTVRGLDGILTSCDFALMMDDRMRLDPYRTVSGHSASCTNTLVPPREFANAIHALGELTIAGSGELTIVGGNFLGWFAALAETFLGINVQIASRDDQILYANKTDSKALLRLIFVDDLNLTPTVKSQTKSLKVMTVACSASDSLQFTPNLPFTGRVLWEGLLPKVFEQKFHLVAHQESKVFVQSVGGAARLFQLLAEDPSSPEKMVSKENRQNPASYGKGLIQTLCNWFPEMRHLQGRLERLQSLGWQETFSKCNSGAEGLGALCGCDVCFIGPADKAKNTLKIPQSFCLLAMMETILNLGLAMSRVTVVPRLYPSRAGILCMYQRQVQKLLKAQQLPPHIKNKEGKEPLEFPEVGIADWTPESWARAQILFGQDWNANYNRRLQNACAIFTGSWPEKDLPENLVALSHEGICTYVLGIQHGDKGTRRADADVIRVASGHIAWRNNCFSRACLGRPQDLPYNDYSWEEAQCDHLTQSLYLK